VDAAGTVLGHHDGIANYTVGQRKGLGIGGGAPHYVVALDVAANRIIVGSREGLAVTSVTASAPVWHGSERESVSAMVRYRMQPVAAQASFDGVTLSVHLAEPVEAVAPGQAVVCYRDDVVLGGGVIECAS
jgi:tRNA-specific 2-thiouridylase